MAATQARRREASNIFFDARLAEQDADDAHRAQIEDAQEAAEQRRRDNTVKLEKLSARRLETVAEAEAAAATLFEKLRSIHEIAAQELIVAGQLRKPLQHLADLPLARRFARYLSKGFRSLPGATTSRYGDLGLVNWFQPADSWLAAEQQGERK